MRALITGATGFIGRRLVAAIAAEGDPPAILSRAPSPAGQPPGVRAFAWQPDAGPPPAEAFRGVDGRPVEVVFHLAGEPIAEGRWTDEKMRRVRESRTLGTRHLVAALEALPAAARPRALISSSAVGYYGSRDDQVLDEDAAPGSDFLAEVCVAWEAEAARAEVLGLRVVRVRTGIVLGEGGGAIARMTLPFKLGLGGRLGHGRQWMAWIHADDVVGLLLHAARTESVRGPMNAVSPSPATNRDFTRALAAAVSRPAFLPVPAAALRLAFGRLAEALLSSQRALPRIAEATGYRFRHPDLDEALRAVLHAHPPAGK